MMKRFSWRTIGRKYEESEREFAKGMFLQDPAITPLNLLQIDILCRKKAVLLILFLEALVRERWLLFPVCNS